jgi:hypothetical protein
MEEPIVSRAPWVCTAGMAPVTPARAQMRHRRLGQRSAVVLLVRPELMPAKDWN